MAYSAVPCSGLIAFYSSTSGTAACVGYDTYGAPNLLPIATQVNGPNGVCTIICYDSGGNTVLPVFCSGIWDESVQHAVPRWTDPGCRVLPGHTPPPNISGCDWNRQCNGY
jgi:hypothetical protein